MGKLIYLLNVSLDGFFETADHTPDFATIDEEIHGWFNDEIRTLDATLYGRRMYEVMAAYWPYGEDDPEATDAMREFSRLWKPMPKIVFSTTLDSVEHNARLVHGDVGAVLDDVRREFDGDIGVGGPNLGNQFVRRGLIDEYRLVIHPVVLGAGTPFWPQLDEPLRLKLLETRTFASGLMAVSYAPAES